MVMSEYLLLNIAVIIIPLILSFERKLKFYKKIPAVIISISIVGSVFIFWDIAAAARGDWSFNHNYITGITLLTLPIEEILFFITIPYSIIFLYETARFYLPDKNIKFGGNLTALAAYFLIAASFFFWNQEYTFTVLLFTGMFFLSAGFLNPELLNSGRFWLFIIFTYVPFAFVNYILTSLPIISYSSYAIWGIRLLTIPAEDFFYSFSLLSFNILIFETAERKWLKKKLP
ncbi:MAG: lycopene cyclase domain-containing protein [Melioribacteraceae bacterium]|nr:lycopene cyclase domain-containing protein [Melioribacteraceae bacterium]